MSPPGAPILAAAGDIACAPTHAFFNGGRGTARWCRARDTSALIRRLDPDVVLALGDTQYGHGRTDEYEHSYARSWGAFLERTRPAVGNHEYASPDARGYFSYFGDRAGPRGQGWYSYELGAWHLVALDSNCRLVPCGRGSAQYRWLKADLAGTDARCVLAYMHHPRFSSGPHGDDPSVTPLWRLLHRAGVDVVLTAHDHIYERFARLTPDGRPDPMYGIRQFVVGTGGAELYAIRAVRRHSEMRSDTDFGVLTLRLGPSTFRWRFEPVDRGGFRDRGRDVCSQSATP